MDATYKQREWIVYNTPSGSEVFEEYPSLFGFVVCVCVACACVCVCVCACAECVFSY